MSTFNDAYETQPAGLTGEYLIRQDLMAIKAEGQTQFEREQRAFLGQIEQHRQSVEQQLRADVDPALSAAVSQAHQALLAARRTAAEARQALSQHEAARPRMAAEVPAWAKRKGELADELSAYESIVADTDGAYQAAQGRVSQALQQTFIKRRAAAQTALERRAAEFDREILAAQAALDQVWTNRKRELEALAEQVNYYDRYQ